jgi:hypothetical protein
VKRINFDEQLPQALGKRAANRGKTKEREVGGMLILFTPASPAISVMPAIQ